MSRSPSSRSTQPSDATADTRVGDVVTYSVTATNTGTGAFTDANPAVVFDDLSKVIDDATYDDDAAASRPGALTYTSRCRWPGALASVRRSSLTYSVTSSGDGTVRNVAWQPNDPRHPRHPGVRSADGWQRPGHR